MQTLHKGGKKVKSFELNPTYFAFNLAFFFFFYTSSDL